MHISPIEVSIIIVNYNGAPYLSQLFDSISQQDFKQFEVIVWDNNSTDDSLTWLQNVTPTFRFQLITSEVNVGFAKANNKAISHAQGKYICLLNNDTYVSSNLIKELYSQITKNNIDVVGPKILFSGKYADVTIISPKLTYVQSLPYLSKDSKFKTFINNDSPLKRLTRFGKIELKAGDSLQIVFDSSNIPQEEFKWHIQTNYRVDTNNHLSNTAFIHLSASLTNNASHIINSVGLVYDPKTGKAIDKGIFEYDKGQYDSHVKVDALSGCCFMIGRKLFQSIKFDESFFMYYEDVDFFVRLKKLNKQANIVLSHKAVVYHHNSSPNQLSKTKIVNNGHLNFIKKHFGTKKYIEFSLLYLYAHLLNLIRKSLYALGQRQR